jgi:hypothetical protein
MQIRVVLNWVSLLAISPLVLGGLTGWGVVPGNNLIGKVTLIFWPTDRFGSPNEKQ